MRKWIGLIVVLVIFGPEVSYASIPRPAWLDKSVASDNFEVWYTDDFIVHPDDAITLADATLVLDYFELVRDVLVMQ